MDVDKERPRGHADFLERVAAMLREEGFTGQPQHGHGQHEPVVRFQHPDKLQVRRAEEESLPGPARPCPGRPGQSVNGGKL